MNKVFAASPARFLAVLLTICPMAAAVHAQAPVPAMPADPVPAQASTPAAAAANDALLAKAAKLYYSTDKAGLAGFDCAVHPDWHALLASDGGSVNADATMRVSLLSSVSIAFHARMKGGSGIDWNPPAHPEKPLDPESTSLLDAMQAGTAQALQGFMQFWTPFVDGSAIPDSAEGVEITPTDKGGYTLHGDQEGTSLTEVLDSDLVLQQFNVATNGMTVNFSPAYKSTDKGLLVSGIVAHIHPSEAAAAQALEMHVAIEYQNIDGFPIPARLKMEALNQGVLNFTLDGCAVNKQAR